MVLLNDSIFVFYYNRIRLVKFHFISTDIVLNVSFILIASMTRVDKMVAPYDLFET